jgi:hypothetical protein
MRHKGIDRFFIRHLFNNAQKQHPNAQDEYRKFDERCTFFVYRRLGSNSDLSLSAKRSVNKIEVWLMQI